jgi:hypothetical protein
MNDMQLREFGFRVSEDDPTVAFSELYPNLSFRHKCSDCGMWSSAYSGKDRKKHCPQCYADKTPIKETKQYFKLYACCFDDDCPIRKEASAFLHEMGIDARWPAHDGFGEYFSLDPIKSLSEAERDQFFTTINNVSVSKFGARQLAHPNSKKRSKLPKKKPTE